MAHFDFAVIGGGMAGASAAYELAADASVCLLERETTPGYHASSRSAATFIEGYGSPAWRSLNSASRRFMENPPEGFASHPLLTPRGVLEVGDADDAPALRAEYERIAARGIGIEWADEVRIAELAPSLRGGQFTCGYFEPGASDIDVDALLQGYLRGLKARAGAMMTGAEVNGLKRTNGTGWSITTRAGEITAGAVVNAAGAWADEIAACAGLPRRGLQPKRRTAIAFRPSRTETPVSTWCMVGDWKETFYYRPFSGDQLLASRADETDSAPCDAQPEELDIAIIADRIQTVSNLEVTRIDHSWAGLRTFAPDRDPVIGPDPEAENFFWLAGQGGTGIVGAPAAAQILSTIALGRPLPPDAETINLAAFDPARLAPC